METIENNSPKASTCQADSEAEANDCAVCLQQIIDKCFTDICLHMFCFPCLLERAKVKPFCPLCNQGFYRIIHNIRSMDDYDEYEVLGVERYPESRGHDFFDCSRHRNWMSYRDAVVSEIPGEIVSSLSNPSSPLQRWEVYLHELKVRPPVVGSHRLSSPEFYRENEGEMHRLRRWVSRELEAIVLFGVRFCPDDVVSLIMDMLPVCEIQSPTFRRALDCIDELADRFIHEFYNFAISPYEMEQYDRACVYVYERTGSQYFPMPPTRSSTIHHQVINITNSENDDRVIIDEVRATVLDDSDTENPQLGVASNASSTPTPSTSGYRPSTSTTHEYDKSILVLPSTSNLTETKPCCMNPKPEHDSSRSEMDSSLENEIRPTNRRSPSIESVISTDHSGRFKRQRMRSIIESDYSSDPGPSRKKKKKSKRKMSKKQRAKKKSTDFNNCTLSSEGSGLESSDSHWEESCRKKKKNRKHSEKCDKQNKKRRKSDRCKPPKRKKSQIDDSDDYREPHKSKRTPAKRKLRSSKETVAEVVTSSSYSSKNSYAEYLSEPSSSSLLNKPKFRSVVKIVEKTNSSKERKVLNCSECEDDGIPGTSSGITANGDRELHSLIIRRNTFSSDSD